MYIDPCEFCAPCMSKLTDSNRGALVNSRVAFYKNVAVICHRRVEQLTVCTFLKRLRSTVVFSRVNRMVQSATFQFCNTYNTNKWRGWRTFGMLPHVAYGEIFATWLSWLTIVREHRVHFRRISSAHHRAVLLD